MSKYLNETVTEDIVVDNLVAKGFPKGLINKHIVRNPDIKKLLSKASKKVDSTSPGFPDISTSIPSKNDFILVCECKADIKFHQSENGDRPVEYAVDGAIHYGEFLSKEYNVVIIGASGMNQDELKISTFFLAKGCTKESIVDLNLSTILSPNEYINHCIYSHEFKHSKLLELNKLSRDLHNYLRDYAKLAENEKPLLIGAIILALLYPSFETGYKDTENDDFLSDEIYEALEKVLKKSKYDVSEDKRKIILNVFSFIKVHPELNRKGTNLESRVLYNLVKKVAEEIIPIIKIYHDLDMVGDFYREFLRYTGGDKKSLGIVLTPTHITDLFAELANLSINDIILDTCAGTGGFIISAYNYMKQNIKDPEKLENLRNQLIAVEQQPQMFALLAINMILREIPLTNVYAENSFDLIPSLTLKNATFGPQNPPYAQKGDGLSELDFFKSLTDCITVNGRAMSILPLSCVISPEFSNIKEKLMENNTLEAVLSMPDDLFYPVGTITCIIIFKVGVPHPKNFKTWFAYCKDDGFVKTKNAGRIDLHNKWNTVKEKWVTSFINRVETPGFSVLKEVGFNDEWIAEAYIETDYSDINDSDIEEVLKNYALFKITHENNSDINEGCDDDEKNI
ncbi:HsdM family class I SAM-dependent methyltransferase [Paraclostridium sordellii]|uniref:site-specific DNA-methyltransferase (adenine-specific) n=1 Tax=Paraclostridium sordellii TaxID=1505 RepID=A0A9P1PCU8_PARSO|nr:N-6 DNA methylase [Paeniclostridium sordellii]CEO35900.1 type I restriction modification system M subunit [[Clostridium] sordellii] [Paeniclostridium sordellii]